MSFNNDRHFPTNVSLDKATATLASALLTEALEKDKKEDPPKPSRWRGRGKWAVLCALWVLFVSVIGPALISSESYTGPIIGLFLGLALLLATVVAAENHFTKED